jgi:hypothetical protein
MKRLILVLSIFAGALSSFAQGGKNHEIFMFNNSAAPAPVYKLGMDPEFPFLRNLSTPEQVVSAMQRAQRSGNSRRVQELNKLLKATGFVRGIKDVTVASVSSYDVPTGSTGNMGSGHYNYLYCQMNTGDTKGWKVTADNGDFIAFLSPCGNAFYPGAYVAPQTVSALEFMPVPSPDSIQVEKTAEYTGEKKCDECKTKEDDCCRCDCEPVYRHHHRRAYYSDCCGW